jgi:hypothetical protein
MLTCRAGKAACTSPLREDFPTARHAMRVATLARDHDGGASHLAGVVGRGDGALSPTNRDVGGLRISSTSQRRRLQNDDRLLMV